MKAEPQARGCELPETDTPSGLQTDERGGRVDAHLTRVPPSDSAHLGVGYRPKNRPPVQQSPSLRAMVRRESRRQVVSSPHETAAAGEAPGRAQRGPHARHGAVFTPGQVRRFVRDRSALRLSASNSTAEETRTHERH